ncbi:MAG: type II toxin-antitoxin system Phd/YefM family antitoxin [Comamonadaceae bacterium]|nr:type II toxin-antitoxin system Phd/YefM family antitoxin [Comamonadaceae bacterium]
MQATIPLSEARANLADTLRRVEQQNEPAFISRRGEPVAVLLSLPMRTRVNASAS